MPPPFDSAWAQLGALGLLATFGLICMYAVLRGRLVPLSTHLRELADRDQRAADWKESWQLERVAREIQAAKDDEILALLRAMNAPASAPAPREPAA